MDARAFLKVSVRSLGLRIPESADTSSQCSCEIKLHNFPVQTAPVPLVFGDCNSNTGPIPSSYYSSNNVYPNPNCIAASFYLDEIALRQLLHLTCFGGSSPCLELVVFSGRQGVSCGLSASKQLGTFKIRVRHEWAEGRPLELHHGWASIGKKKLNGGRPRAELHAYIKVEPDPRFVFQFDGEPALSSQIIQSQGSSRQPIFSCKFSRDRSGRGGLDDAFKGWTISSNTDKDKEKKERKGWLLMIHDLSGSPVAAASMVTPFVPSSGSNHVSRSNPGAWLILRPEPGGLLRRPEPGGVSSWCPWGRLEAWREQGLKGGLGCRFQLVREGGGVNGVRDGILISETVISAHKGGDFLIDTGKTFSDAPFLVDSPHGSGDFSFNMALSSLTGFVMSCSIQGKGRSNKKRIKPVVQLAARHVSCVEDAALFMALAAAVDLSMDACQPFTRKLRKELFDAVTSMQD